MLVFLLVILEINCRVINKDFIFANTHQISKREASCPQDTHICETPFNYQFTYHFLCDDSITCPDQFVCCSDSCYTHKICKPAVYTDSDNNCVDYFKCSTPLPFDSLKDLSCESYSCPEGYECCTHSCFSFKICQTAYKVDRTWSTTDLVSSTSSDFEFVNVDTSLSTLSTRTRATQTLIDDDTNTKTTFLNTENTFESSNTIDKITEKVTTSARTKTTLSETTFKTSTVKNSEDDKDSIEANGKETNGITNTITTSASAKTTSVKTNLSTFKTSTNEILEDDEDRIEASGDEINSITNTVTTSASAKTTSVETNLPTFKTSTVEILEDDEDIIEASGEASITNTVTTSTSAKTTFVNTNLPTFKISTIKISGDDEDSIEAGGNDIFNFSNVATTSAITRNTKTIKDLTNKPKETLEEKNNKVELDYTTKIDSTKTTKSNITTARSTEEKLELVTTTARLLPTVTPSSQIVAEELENNNTTYPNQDDKDQLEANNIATSVKALSASAKTSQFLPSITNNNDKSFIGSGDDLYFDSNTNASTSAIVAKITPSFPLLELEDDEDLIEASGN